MSLVAITNGNYAVIVSDGLSWDGATGQPVDEHARKQIELGPDIVIAAGGYL